ncbi:MAG: hypothetical protein HY698_15160 [Deltaproteobacteria bacterium]|nr:hypothetical protein [Deltaproteobacteria bacterium]
MRKNTAKLSLNKETIRELTLGTVVGGKKKKVSEPPKDSCGKCDFTNEPIVIVVKAR